MKRIYHYIGSVYFTLVLIPLTALFVATGTVLESLSNSHSYAAHWTYESPLFTVLLTCFFANILISALRRWPFRRRHIPFLLTHLGLLMVIAGVMVKTQFGIQGVLVSWEGSASNEVLSSKENAIVIRNKLGQKAILPVAIGNGISLDNEQWKILSTAPHSEEKIDSWIVDNTLFIHGLSPMPLPDTLESLGSIRVHNSSSEPWTVHGKVGDDPINLIKTHWMKNAHVTLKDHRDKSILFEGIALESPGLALDEKDGIFTLTWDYPPYSIEMALTEGAQPQDKATSYLGTCPIDVEISYPQSLCFLRCKEENKLFAIDSCGAIQNQKPETLVTYENGFKGIFSQLVVPFGEVPRKPKPALEILRDTLSTIKDPALLSPPLQLVFSENFPSALIQFLEQWDRSHEWFYSESGSIIPDFPVIEWGKQEELYKAAYWTIQIIEPLIEGVKQGKDLLSQLQDRKWPLIDELMHTHSLSDSVPHEKMEPVLRHLSQQIFLITEHLPKAPPYTESMNQRLYSAYLRTYGIHLSTLTPPVELEKLEDLPKLESPIIHKITSIEPMPKWEDNRPLAVLGNGNEEIALAYDPSGKKLPRPNLKGTALFNYQPKPIYIPYRLRVHEAVQINYANSSQAHRYECTAFIHDGVKEEKIVLSMNQVHETWDGFRFYLASIYPDDAGQAHQVRIVVNHDPAKYWLTYPGCMILVLGIALFYGHFGGRAQDSKIGES